MSELTGSNHRFRARFKSVRTVVSQRFAGNGPNGLSYYYCHYYSFYLLSQQFLPLITKPTRFIDCHLTFCLSLPSLLVFQTQIIVPYLPVTFGPYWMYFDLQFTSGILYPDDNWSLLHVSVVTVGLHIMHLKRLGCRLGVKSWKLWSFFLMNG